MSELIPASLPPSVPAAAKMPAAGPENAESAGDGKDSFAAALQSAQRPDAESASNEARSPAEKTTDQAATPDPTAANPAAAALVASAVVTPVPAPVVTAAAESSAGAAGVARAATVDGLAASGRAGVNASALASPGTTPQSAGPVATLQSEAAASGDAQAAAPAPVPVTATAVSAASVQAASVGDDFADVLSSLGLKPMAGESTKPQVAPAAQPAGQPASAAATNLVSTAALPTAGAEGLELKLTEVPDLVVESPVAKTEAGSAATSQSTAAAGQALQTPARTHAGVLHLDAQLPVHSPRFADGFTQQVVVLAQNGIQQAQMSLNPPELGPIDVRITVQQDAASVQIAASSAVAREAIQDALPKLRDMLDQSGVRLNDAGVFAQLPQREQSAGSQQQRSDWQMAAPFGQSPGADLAAPATRVVRRVGLLDAYA